MYFVGPLDRLVPKLTSAGISVAEEAAAFVGTELADSHLVLRHSTEVPESTK